MKAQFVVGWIAACFFCGVLQAQVPMVPAWGHVDAFGAGSWYPYSDQMRTRLAFDHATNRLHRTVMDPMTINVFTVQTFDAEGIDLTPADPTTFESRPGYADGLEHDIVRLFADSSKLSAIIHFEVTWDEMRNWNSVQMLNENGEVDLLIGSGSTSMFDMWHDGTGTLVLVADELRSYGLTNWPTGIIPADRASRMAILENSAVLGVAPSIHRIDRTTLTALTPIAVPSNGTAVSGVCLANGTTAFNYATVNTNGTIDLGLADIGSGLVWNTTITIPSGTEPTAYHVDEQGNFWIAFSRIEAGLNAQGLLYGFSPLGDPSPVGSYGRSIDDITSGGSKLFLTGRQPGDMTSTYVAAFSTEFTMGAPGAAHDAMLEPFPNPASQALSINGIKREVERIIVIDATGRSLKELTGPFGTTVNFSIADLAPGAYFVRIEARAGSTTLPFQVSR